jgi:hypothetical protein
MEISSKGEIMIYRRQTKKHHIVSETYGQRETSREDGNVYSVSSNIHPIRRLFYRSSTKTYRGKKKECKRAGERADGSTPRRIDAPTDRLTDKKNNKKKPRMSYNKQ